MRTVSRRSDCGLTLVELVVTVAILGLVTTALAASVSVFLRNQTGPVSRMDDARDLQQLVNYVPADVGSARVVEVNPPWTQPCLTTGTPILNVVITESFPGEATETISVTYVRSPSGTEVVRNRCDPASTSSVMARDIAGADAEFTAGATCGEPVSVDMWVIHGLERSTLTATSRNRTVEDGCP